MDSERDPFFISLETIIASSTLLGHALESRRPVRDRQELELFQHFAAHSEVPLSSDAQRSLFTCAPLDILVGRRDGRKEFHVIELNGTGIGGVTNMPGPVVAPILDSLEEIAGELDDPEGIVLLGVSGKESPVKPRLNHLMHEKMLFAEALKEGLRKRHGMASVAAVPHVASDPSVLSRKHPVVVLGYMKELIAQLDIGRDGKLSLLGRRVTAILNDRFCLNVLDHFGVKASLTDMRPINSCFLPGADKAVAYELMNQFLEASPAEHFPPRVLFKLARDRSTLIQTVASWLRKGRKVVIKPHATGVGHGIEFFLDCDAGIQEIVKRIDGSIRLTSDYYDATGGAFPYTVCEFVDTCSIDRATHPLYRHKYELRVVVYRDGGSLRAFPSIVKIASRPFDATAVDRLSLINNVTAATESSSKKGVDFVLPLSNRNTLDLLGLSIDELTSLSSTCTRYVRHILDRLEESPGRFGFETGESSDDDT